eukprot:gene1179-858_t
MAAFEALIDPANNITELQTYLDQYFLPAGSDLVPWVPPDYNPEPPIVQNMSDSYVYKNFTKDINALWLVLGRNITEEVVEHPERHSFVPLAHPMVVPGGRFRESYYWDTWWIMRGLLVCDMNTTAYYVLDNLMHEVELFGFVPNGARIYYLDRSQPPVLSEMVVDYLEYNLRQSAQVVTPFLASFVDRAVSLLETEYAWWMNKTTQHVLTFSLPTSSILTADQPFLNPQGGAFIPAYLNRYHSNASSPRPESFAPDYHNSLFDVRTDAEVNTFYHNVRAGAESGWDFSSRWIAGMTNISFIETTEIVPVELNCYLYKLEQNLAYLLKLQANHQSSQGAISAAAAQELQWTAGNYTVAARLRYYAIQEFLWDNASYHWRDYNLTSQSFAQRNVTGSGDEASSTYSTVAYWLPLWAQIYPNMTTSLPDQLNLTATPTAATTATTLTTVDVCEGLVSSLLQSHLIQVGGVLTTTAQNTGQQWDAPNAWPPLVLLLIEGLTRLAQDSEDPHHASRQCARAGAMAANVTKLWLETNYVAFNRTGYMYEKYNAYEMGIGGGGGEYTPQIGFGWTNGVALILINDTYRVHDHNYFDDDHRPADDDAIVISFDDDVDLSPGAMAASVILPFAFITAVLIGVFYCYQKRQTTHGLTAPMLADAEVVSPLPLAHSSPPPIVGVVQNVQLVDHRSPAPTVEKHDGTYATATALPV